MKLKKKEMKRKEDIRHVITNCDPVFSVIMEVKLRKHKESREITIKLQNS